MGVIAIVLSAVLAFAPQIPANHDMGEVLKEAHELAQAGDWEGALQKHIWFHEHALEYEPAMYGVRLSFALSDWARLGEKYPRAHEVLVATRDADAAKLVEDGRPVTLFHDLTAINQYLNDEANTAQCFKDVVAKHSDAAGELFPLAEEALFNAGELELCGRYIGPAKARFEAIRERRKSLIAAGADGPRPEGLAAFAEKGFEEETHRLIVILVAAKRSPEAQEIRDAALAVRDDAALRQSLDAALKQPTTKPS